MDHQHFLKSLHYGIPSHQGFIDSENRRYYIILSESEFTGLKNLQFIWNPRISDDQVPADQQGYHNVMWLNCLSVAVIHALVSEWLTPSSSTQWRKMGMAATTCSVAYSEAHFRAHRSRMVDVQGSVTSRPPPHTKRSPSCSWQSSSQTSLSGEPSLQCLNVKDSISVHVRACPLSGVNQHLSLVGGFISQGDHVHHSGSTQ